MIPNSSFSADFENQGAHRLAKQHDPEGKRTIGTLIPVVLSRLSLNFIDILGVLTKPDRIPTGEETNWIPFIRNEKETLENNWYCVKQPSSSDIKLGITWSQARQREQDFFAMTPPWSELDAVYQKYLKTSNLVDRLSSILSDLISKRSLSLFLPFLPVSYSSFCQFTGSRKSKMNSKSP